MKIIYFVRSVPPYWSNRIDVDYIIKALIGEGHEVSIYDIKQRMLLNCNNEERTYFFTKIKFLDKTPFYLLNNFFVFFLFLIKERNNFDVTHIFYVREEQLILARLIHKFSKKIFITIYGSDLNIKNAIKNKFKRLYQYVDIITATNQGLLDKLIKENKEYNLSSKTKVIMLPQIRFKKYDKFVWDDKKNAKKKLGVSKYKKVIIVGTSAANYEQHFLIIDEIAKIKTNNLLFVFPLTYGSGNFYEYRLKVKEYAKNKIIKNDIKVLFEYMSEDELADLRKASDIFINLRKNDQLVAAMLESFLCGVEVITGSWLPYEVLDNIGICYVKINSMKNITSILLDIIEQNINNIDFEKNRNLILMNYSVEKDLKDWISIYN